ncbi:MAG: glycoside hydrolase domain-containing protein, partial [Armatimonadota bacterium]
LEIPGSEQDTWPGIGFLPQTDTTQYQVLAFDAFNPHTDDVALSWRIDLEDGTTRFEGARLRASETTRVEVWLTGLGPVTRIYLYRRMPRDDRTIYLDNFHWATPGERFTALHYVDGATPPAPRELERQHGFIVFTRPLTDVIFTNSVPRAEERIQSVDVFATVGEYEPATFALYALENLAQVRVSFEGVPAGGEVLPVRCLNKRVTYSSDQYIADMPVLCERREAVDVPAGTCRRWVIDLGLFGDAPAGLHEGAVRIAARGRDPVTLPLRLRVLPYALLEPTDMFWGEYYQGPRFAQTDDGRVEEMRRDLADQRAHGMTSVGLCFGVPSEAITWADDGACVLSLDGTQYAAFMDLYVELGFPMPVILLSDSGQAAAGMAGEFAFESDEWATRYQAFWRAMQAEHQRRGWPEVIVQPVDEPGWQDQAAKDRNLRCLQLLKQIPGLRTEQDGPGDAYFHDVAGPFADVWNYNGVIAEPDVVAEAQAARHIVTIYNCDVESYRPEVDRYVAGWFQLAAGINGCYNWAYMDWGGSPYDDNDHAYGTWMHVYPPLGDEPGGPSIGWIGAREGVHDYRYVHTLRVAIARALASDSAAAQRAAREAQAELDRLIASLSYSPHIRNTAKWTTSHTREDGTRTIGGTLKLPNGWAHSDYQAHRWVIAEQTMRVLEALGEVEGQ